MTSGKAVRVGKVLDVIAVVLQWQWGGWVAPHWEAAGLTGGDPCGRCACPGSQASLCPSLQQRDAPDTPRAVSQSSSAGVGWVPLGVGRGDTFGKPGLFPGKWEASWPSAE